jgi:hypothetical protein
MGALIIVKEPQSLEYFRAQTLGRLPMLQSTESWARVSRALKVGLSSSSASSPVLGDAGVLSPPDVIAASEPRDVLPPYQGMSQAQRHGHRASTNAAAFHGSCARTNLPQEAILPGPATYPGPRGWGRMSPGAGPPSNSGRALAS